MTSTDDTSRLAHPKYRPDIDGLRAIAVLSVVGFHAFPKIMPGGFIGVDVFFVISGFLISTIIFESLDDGKFSFVEFYTRRIRRIFPALIVVLAACLIFGWFALLAREYKQLGLHVAAGMGFVSNLVLSGENGYFANASDTKPLLHLWSLGIEEQFYIVWPLMAWSIWKFRLNPLACTLALIVCSFVLNVRGVVPDPVATFYSPLTRGWELLAGATLAHIRLHRQPEESGYKALANIQSIVAICAILLFAVLAHGKIRFPGWWALVPVVSALAIISAGASARVNRSVLSNPILVWIGLISFPLYLWHWPLLSFARILEGETPPVQVRLAAVLLSILLAWLTYRIVELPIRKGNLFGNRSPVALVGAAAAVLIAGIIVNAQYGFPKRNPELQAFNDFPTDYNSPLSNPTCAKKFAPLFSEKFIAERDICLLDEKKSGPRILMIGDSHALKLYEAFHQLGVDDILLLGRGSCAPILDAPNVSWLKCQPTGDRIIDFALASESDLLILTGVFERYFDGTYGEQPLQVMEDRIRQTFQKLGRSGKKVLVVIDNPSLPFDSGICAKRPIAIREPPECSFSRAFFDDKTRRYRELFGKYAAENNVQLLDTSPLFCRGDRCFAYDKDGLLYTGDNNHLSMRGARMVDREIMKRHAEIFQSRAATGQ